ncbi:Hsp20/alpha crystallin family protein [Spirillospora sp. CA-255316]
MTQQPVRRPTGRNVAVYDPARQFEELHDQMGQLLNLAFGLPAGAQAQVEGPWIPAADVAESEEAYIVDIDVPGVRREDLDIQLNDRELSVAGEIVEKERAKLRRRTRKVGRFEFRGMLPGDVDVDKVEAKLEHGVLTLTLPKAQAARPKHIEVSR